jgi:predicted acyl esterase
MDRDVEIASDVPVAMRDGTMLRADVYRPRVDGRLPALLLRIPYNKDLAQSYVYAHLSFAKTVSGSLDGRLRLSGRLETLGTG